MIKIRKSVFETNSSSCHCLTIGSKESFDKLESYDYIYTDLIEYHDDYGEYKTMLNPEYITPIDSIIQEMQEKCKKYNVNDITIDEFTYRFYLGDSKYTNEFFNKLYSAFNFSNKEKYDFIMNYKIIFQEILEYDITNTDFVLHYHDNDNSILEDYGKIVSDMGEDTKLYRYVKVIC